ncbi:MarR family winged helix-turn-helix transcriptional regulator [Blastococcus sp. LR1]|uniref:MarR family winged helix-turn-helix transcriptional regulator n=1 Tax=Blastococcus sp. LR1 TaxID=2877000 RepID=UPI001CCFE048|nr:MarR family transcriptional regulator [Blastococcus sp. LR1]MCA0145911.1 MarR family transcriptional regulator [Blastococcus sp. LR1]
MSANSSPGRDADVAALAELLPRMMRVLHGLKSQLGADGRDRAALVLLFPLSRLGPLRQSALSDLVHADPSTVSRHVSALVDQGLVRRTADESDGRATRLVVTDAGHAVLEGLRHEREKHLGSITADWPEADLTALTTLFGRLLDGLAAGLPAATPPRTDTRSPKDDA